MAYCTGCAALEALVDKQIARAERAEAALASLREARVAYYCAGCEGYARERDEAVGLLADLRWLTKGTKQEEINEPFMGDVDAFLARLDAAAKGEDAK